MASLVASDTSGVFVQGPDEVEVPELRTLSSRKFRLPNARDGRRRWRLSAAIGPIHYRSDGDPFGEALFDEIDLGLRPNVVSGDDRWRMERCGYHARMYETLNGLPYCAEYRRAGAHCRMAPLGLFWQDALGNLTLIRKPIAGLTEEASEGYGLWWPGAFGPGTAFGYDLRPDQFRKVVRLDKPADLGGRPLAATHLVVGLALTWRGAAPRAFARGVATSEVAELDLKSTVNERADKPGRFPCLREDSREAWWFGQPLAWDSADERKTWECKWWLERRGAQVVLFVGLPVSALDEAQWPMFLDGTITNLQATASEDDAGNAGGTHPGDGNFATTATLQYQGASTTVFYITGWRFAPTIPQGSTIDSATLTFYSTLALAMSANLVIGCEDVDNAGVFATTTHEPYDSYLAATTAQVAFAPNWAAGAWEVSPSLVTPVQEVISRPGFASGNGLVFVTWYQPTSLPGSNDRVRCYTWDQTGNTSGPKFNCAYTEVAAGRALFLGPNLWTGGKALIREANL